MTLSVRCTHCGWLFRVDAVFAGGRARCRHCGGVTDVPPDPHAAMALPRPMRPAGKQPHVRPHAANPRWGLSALWRMLGLRRGVGILAGLAVLTTLGVWQWMSNSPHSGTIDRRMAPEDVDVRLVARVPPEPVLRDLPRTFLGKPLTSRQVAWLIDGSAGMAPYYGDVTTLVATSMAVMQPGQQKFGVYLVAENAADTLPPVTAGAAALETARGAMRKFRAGGRADLGAAFEQVAAWKPDVIFLVLSQPTNDAAREGMIRRARSNHITVHVAAVGEQPYFGWRSLAEETRGSFVRLDARELGLWIDRATHPTPVGFETRTRGAPISVGPTADQ